MASFNRVGNLAFYDGWNPNYVYFNSLLYANQTYGLKKGPSPWDAQEAASIANRAISNAKAHANFGDIRERGESNEYLFEQFKRIVQFLSRARKYELNNELNFFKDKFKELKVQFKDEEKNITKLIHMVQASLQSKNHAVNYRALITLINFVQQGIESTAKTASYEQERIQEISDIIKELRDSRSSQVAGLAKSRGKDLTAQLEWGKKASEKLWKEIKVEYAEHAQLTRKIEVTDKKTKQTVKKYALWGGATFENKVKKTVSTTLAHWANDVVEDIIKNPNTVKKIVKKIQKKYSTSDNTTFYTLEQDVRETLILAIIQYGLNNLGDVLSRDLNQVFLSEIKHNLKVDDEIFDTVQHYNIRGLNNSFGLKGDELQLFKDAKTSADINIRHATTLADAFKNMLNTAKKTDEQDFLMHLLSDKNIKKKDRVEQLVQLINSLEAIQKEGAKLLEEYKKSVDKLPKSIETKDTPIPITITVKRGKVSVNMDQVKQMLGVNDTFLSLNFKTFNPSNLTRAIATIKGRASQELKQIIIEAIDQAGRLHLTTLSQQELVATMRQGLENLQVKVKGPSLAELMTNIHFRSQGEDLIVDWTGGINGKNDSVTIEIKHKNILAKIEEELPEKFLNSMNMLQQQVEKKQLAVLNEYRNIVNKEVGQLTRKNDLHKYTSIIDSTIASMEELREQNTDLDKLYEDLEKEIKKLDKKLKQAGLKLQERKELKKEFLDVFKNSFQVSTTVKSYDTYVNKMGFTGGSLGTGLDDQLTRISDIFATAGAPIKPKDYEWLRSAILNCFPGSIVGETNKNTIEAYLGAAAAFALFDEGGAEAALISNYYKTYFDSINKNSEGRSASSILHLYYVNGIYVPGSYVIEQTLNVIRTKIIPSIQHIPDLMRTGAGIMIINNASPSVIPNRPIAKYFSEDNNGANPNAWEITGQEVAKQIKIKILFLAGLLGIVNDINETMGSLQMLS